MPTVFGEALNISPYTAQGTISALNGFVSVDCPGSHSAVVSVTGNFVGTLTFTGSAGFTADVTAGTVFSGGRLAFKSGVGSIGSNSVIFTGTGSGTAEYRVVTGGQSMRVTATSYTSGTATIYMVASSEAAINFTNGPVHTAMEEASRAGRSFSAGTGMQAVAANNYLNYILANPAGSNVRMFIQRRLFSNNNTGTPVENGLIVNPVALTSPNTGTIVNTLGNSGVASVATFKWNVATSRLDTSPTTATPLGAALPNNGSMYEILSERILVPGESLGYYLGGSGGGLAAAIRAAMTITWYEESIN